MNIDVTYHGYTQATLAQITRHTGGTAAWAGEGSPEEQYREFAGSTIVFGVESLESAREIIYNEFNQALHDDVDMSRLTLEARRDM